MSPLFFLFALFYQAAVSGIFAIPVSDSADFLVVPILSQPHDFQVQCSPSSPKTVQKWRENSGAKYVVNAGFFDEKMDPVGYVKTKDQVWGSLQNHPALFTVTTSGPGIVRSEDKNMEPTLITAASGFPVLVWNQENQFLKETGKYARRTIVGEKNGQIYFFVSVRGYPSLAESAGALKKFGIEKALNLDGGTSTGFSSEQREIYSIPVPCVILVFPKSLS